MRTPSGRRRRCRTTWACPDAARRPCSTQRTPMCFERLGHQVEAAHRDAAGQDQDLVRVQVQRAAARAAVRHRRARWSSATRWKPRWRRAAADRVGVRAADLVRRDRIARLDQLIAGGDHDDGRLAADSHAGHAGGGGHRDLRGMQDVAGRRAAARPGAVAGAPMHVVPGRRIHARLRARHSRRRCRSCSTGTTVSQPPGSTAPVMTSMQWSSEASAAAGHRPPEWLAP